MTSSQHFDCAQASTSILPGDSEQRAPLGAHCQEDRVKLSSQFLKADFFPDAGVTPQFHAESKDISNFAVQDRTRQPVRRNAPAKHSPCFGQGLKKGRLEALPGK